MPLYLQRKKSNTYRDVICLLLLVPYAVFARVGGECMSCHTMHNSQDNFLVTEGGVTNPALLISDCVGCHTGQNTGLNTTPYVFSTTSPDYKTTGTEAGSNTLAGGNFYWVTNLGDRRGHNVQGIAAIDQMLSGPPGGDGSFSGQLSCAGTMGCHGNRNISGQILAVKGSHHSKNHQVWQAGTQLTNSYRMIDTIQGFGSLDYEYQPTDGKHNKYYGVDRSSEQEAPPGTISSHCAQCHQYYHNGSTSLDPGNSFGAGVWLRHPVDYDMSSAASSTEYQLYNNSESQGNNPYSVVAPLATSHISEDLNTTVFTRENDAIVMCLSCHRAHGSPYAGSMRWDYRGWPASGYNGCAVCHTSKD